MPVYTEKKPGKMARSVSEFLTEHGTFAEEYNSILAEKYLEPESGKEDESE